jgi:AbrB family looped-hinge helix DNA binding protein
MRTTVSEKGQVTIPKRLRDRLGIRPGEVLEFIEEDGRLVATKAMPQDSVDAVYGILDLGRPTEAVITRLRGRADAI